MAHRLLNRFLDLEAKNAANARRRGYFCGGVSCNRDRCPFFPRRPWGWGCLGLEAVSHLRDILENEYTWRVWMELHGHTPAFKWEEE